MAEIGQFSGLGMYDEGGKFEVKQEFIDKARAKAIEEGKKYYGDATNFEVFRDGILNLPDSAINFVARGAEGTGELFAGLASLVMKSGQLATTTDPDKLTQIMSEPSFTKYMGAFRDKIPTPNLYESDISGIEDTEKAFGTAGYYAAPVPVAPIAKGAAQVAKGLGSTKFGKNMIDELETTATYFPNYTPFKKVEPKSVGAMSIDELIKSNQIKKASEITQDPLTLMARERDRFQKIVEAKGKRGKLFDVGSESTEGTFKYKGETYNKSDGVLIGFPSSRVSRSFDKNWIPKEKVGQTSKKGIKNSETIEIENILKNNFTNDELLNMRNKEIVSFLQEKGINFSSRTPEVTVGQIRKNMTGKTTEGRGAISKPDSEKVVRKIGTQLLNEFDSTSQTAINNFTDDIFKLTGFSKTSDDAMRINSPIRRYLNNALIAVKNGKATKQEVIEQLNKVDKEKLSDVLKKYFNLRNKLKKSNELEIGLDDLNLSHMENIADNWRTALDANNLFIATKKANQVIQRKLDKDLSKIFEKFRGAKTISEKKEIVKEFKNVKKELIDNNLVSIIDGKKIGADIDFEKSFEKFSSAADTAINKRLFRKDGGMMNINDITGPLGNF